MANRLLTRPTASPVGMGGDAVLVTSRGAGFLTIASVFVGLGNYAYSLLLARLLSPELFADFAAAQGALLICGTVATASMPWVVAHVIATKPGRQQRQDVVWFSLMTNALQGSVAAAVVVLITGQFLTAGETAWTGAAAFAIFIVTTPAGTFQGDQRFTALSVVRIGEVVVKFAIGMLLVSLGAGVAGALAGAALAAALVAAVGLVVIRRELRPARSARELGYLKRTSLGVVGIQGLVAVLGSLDVVLVGLLNDAAADAGSYQASAILGRVPLFLGGALATAAYPALARGGPTARTVMTNALSTYLFLSGVFVAILLTAPDAVLGSLFPPEYARVDDFVPFTALAGAGIGAVNVVTSWFQAAGSYHRAVSLQALGLGISLAALGFGFALGGLSGLAVAAPIGPILTTVLLLFGAPEIRPRLRGVWRDLVLLVVLIPAVIITSPWPSLWLAAAGLVGVVALWRLLSAPAVGGTRSHSSAPPRRAALQGRHRLANPAVREVGAHRMRREPSSSAAQYELGHSGARVGRNANGSAVVTSSNAAPARTPSGVRRWLNRPLVLETAVFTLAVLARGIENGRRFDVFVDEVTYLRIAQGAAEDLAVRLYGEPFHLHPPGFTYLQAAWLWLTGGVQGTAIEQVLEVRWMNILLAGLTAVAAVRLVVLLTGSRWAGAAVGLVASLDPFLVRVSSRNLLETAAMLLILVGWSLLLHNVVDRRGQAAWRPAAAGAVFGVAILVKDPAALYTLLPLGVSAATGWPIGRQTAAVTASVACVVYSIYPLATALAGQWGDLVDQKYNGLLRLVGVVQTTGFNAPGSAPFAERLVERLELFGPTYVLMAVGVPFIVLVMRRGDAAARVIGLWAASAYAYAAWSIVGGTLEEQLFYFVAVPAAVVVVYSATRWEWRRVGFRRAIVASVLVLWSAASLTSWMIAYSRPDDTYRRMTEWVANELTGSPIVRVGVTSDPGDVLLRGVDIVPVDSLDEARRADAEYVLISTQAVKNGTARVSPDLIALIDLPGAVVHEESGPSAGRLVMVEVPPG